MMLTLKQAKGGNHCHMKVWQNAAINKTPPTSEPNYHTLEDMFVAEIRKIWNRIIIKGGLMSTMSLISLNNILL